MTTTFPRLATADHALEMIEMILALGLQLLIADNPDLLLPPEVPVIHPSRRLVRARAVATLIRETHHALERYRDIDRDRRAPTRVTAIDDDFPF